MSGSQDAALLDALDRHARRRAEGLATVSLLVGEPERAWAVWSAWLQRQGRSAATSESEDARELVSAWATTLARGWDLTVEAERFTQQTQPPGSRRELRFQGKTAHERRILLDSLSAPSHAPGTWAVCRRLLETPAPPPPGVLPEPVRELIARDPGAALQALLGLVPPGESPALGVRVGTGSVQGPRAVAALCIAAPAFTVACVLSPEAFAGQQRQGESRMLALMREGRLDIESPPAPPPLPPEAQERARSKPEWFLYQMLHHRLSTGGLFSLNAMVEGGEGERAWQVDLLCRELKLAVEIDGYFHFRDASAFRRDRRKDVALQRAGYLVYRVLADDVATRLEEILVELDTLIANRRRTFSGQEPPHES